MTSTDFTANRENYCYRHPDRQSFVLCQRCLRTVCPDCQTQAAVGVICPECLKAQRKAESPAQRKARMRWGGGGAIGAAARRGAPVATYALLAVTAVVGLLQVFVPAVTGALLFAAPYIMPGTLYPFEPWRLLTAVFVHGGIWHFLLNMLALYMLGQVLEPMLGRARFVTLYLLSGIGGSVAVGILAPLTATVGASGAVFGLLGAMLVIGRHVGANITGILVILGINLVIGFVPGFNIAWQAHLGGLAIGALIGLILARTRRPAQRTLQIVLLVGVGLLLVGAAAFLPAIVLNALVG